jgi:hypothetical protein
MVLTTVAFPLTSRKDDPAFYFPRQLSLVDELLICLRARLEAAQIDEPDRVGTAVRVRVG